MGRGERVRGMEGSEGRERVGKGLDVDICPAAGEFLVTPVSVSMTAYIARMAA